jgi:6-phosphogluconolactonase (cycloisomerase 2 family)
LAALCVAATLAACGGGGGGGGTGSGGGGTLGATAPTRFLYASAYPSASFTQNLGGVYAFRFDTGAGRLTPVSNAAFAPETIGAPIVLSRDSKFLYSIDLLTNDHALAAYAVQPDGWLMPVASQPFDAGESISTLAADPAGDFLYAVAASGNLQVYSLDSSTGAPTQRSSVNGLAAGVALITPDGRHLYYATPNGIYEFAIDAASGGLTPLAGSPVAYHIVPGPGVIDPSGKFLYVTNVDPSATSGAQVSAWSIDSATGELSAIPLSPSATTTGPQVGVAVDGSGTFAIVTTSSDPDPSCFYVFGADATTGALTPVSGSPFAGDCGQVVPDVSYNYLYGGSSAGVDVYLLDQKGAVQLGPHVIVVGGRVTHVAVSH